MNDFEKAIVSLEKQGLIEQQTGSEDDPVYGLTPRGQQGMGHDARVERLMNAAFDWADLRGVDLEVEEEKGCLALYMNDEAEFNWHWDFDDDDFWQALDEYLEEIRPAGTRCLPGNLDREDLEDELSVFDTVGPFTVDLYRSDAWQYRVEVVDCVTGRVERRQLVWTPKTTREQFLCALTDPIKGRINEISARKLSAAELDKLEALSPEARAIAEKSSFIRDKLGRPVTLGHVIDLARQDVLSAHWRLRNLIDELAMPAAAGPALN